MATLAAVTNMPALALLGEDGRLERSTEPFRRWYEGNEELCRQAPELARVLDGQASAAVLKLDGIAVDIAAIADRDGARHVLLTVPTDELPSLGDAGGALLDGALDESPALVWLKDLDGRYVRANSRFTTFLSTSEDRLLGRTDAELPPAETVDGPRTQDRPDGVEEPLHLEYFVGSFQGRDALVVLRFPVGDRQGVPTLVCGVAAPSSEAEVARSEAARLLRVERWSRLDAASVRAEILADWRLLPDTRSRSTPATSGSEQPPASSDREQQAAVAEARAERATAVAERDSALSANEKLTLELQATHARLTELERALQAARENGQRGDAEAALAAQAADLERAVSRERERADELERTLTLVRERLGDDAEAARVEVQRARTDAEAARTEVQRARADAEAARADLEKARTDADAVRTAATAERESAASAKAALEREVQQARDHLAALERQQGADDSGAQLRSAEKARIAAEAALADAVAERDATLKARAALTGELDQERKQVSTLRDSSAAAEERIRELTGGMERERIRAAGLEPAQARVKELEGELRAALVGGDKLEGELRLTVARADKAEGELSAAVARADHAEVELRAAAMRADKAEVEIEHWQTRAKRAETDLERGQARLEELEGELRAAVARANQAEGDLRVTAMRADQAEVELERVQARTKEVENELERARPRIEGLAGEVRAAVARAEMAEGEVRPAAMRADKSEVELERVQARLEEIEGELERGRARVEEVEGELERGRMRLGEVEGELERRQTRIEELEDELERGRAGAEEADTAIAELEARLENAVPQPAPPVAEAFDPAAADREPAIPAPAAELARLDPVDEASPAQAVGGVSWQPTAKRTLSASLARESVWRNVLKETVQVLGSEGGWDTVTAWLPDESNSLGCAATWAAHRGLDRFEALTADAALKREGSLLDQALQAPHLTWLTDIDTVDDERLQSAAAHGMNSALLLPVRNGNATIGLLELLTHDSIEPDAQIALSLEASALQLGRFGHLLSLGTK